MAAAAQRRRDQRSLRATVRKPVLPIEESAVFEDRTELR
jgi:hypothetical protein